MKNEIVNACEPFLPWMKDAAERAGEIIMKYYSLGNEAQKIEIKSDSSPVTVADKKANELIVGAVKENVPESFGEYGILAEESADDTSRLSKDWCFIIDPLDGTKEFIAGLPEFTVNIGVSYKGRAVMGVIYSPATKEMFWAVEGRGAYKDGKKIHVSRRKRKIILLHSRYHLDDATKALIERNRHRISEIATAGSSLKVMRIAEGKADVYYRLGKTMEWDTCAEQIILTEAGGIMRDSNDKIITYNRPDTCNRIGFYVINKEQNRLETGD